MAAAIFGKRLLLQYSLGEMVPMFEKQNGSHYSEKKRENIAIFVSWHKKATIIPILLFILHFYYVRFVPQNLRNTTGHFDDAVCWSAKMPVLIYEKDSCVVISREGLNIAIYQCGGTEICYHVGHECGFSKGNIVGLNIRVSGVANPWSLVW